MNKRRWSQNEKWMIVLSCGVCVPGLLVGWFYEHQNKLPPRPTIEKEMPPANNAFDVLMATLPSVTRPPAARWVKGACKSTGAVVDREFDCSSGKALYTPEYNRAYPLKNKLAFLQTNAAALKIWRASLSLPLYVPNQMPRAQGRLWRRRGAFGVLARIQARACWQRGDNDSALDWLLIWHRDLCRQTLSFHGGRNHPVTLDLVKDLEFSRHEATDEIKLLLPFLSAAQLQRASLRLQANRALVPSRVEAAREGKKKWMPRVYAACATQSFQGFAAEHDVSWVKSIWTERLRWANKKAGFARIEKQWDWIIAGETGPLQPVEVQVAKRPVWKDSDPFRRLEPFCSNLRRSAAASQDASELVLLTAMAARSFALKNRRNPRNLNELVPRFLRKIEPDPFNVPQPLQYNAKPKSYLLFRAGKPVFTKPLPPNALPVPKRPLPGQGIQTGFLWTRTRETLPFVLYSIGQNGRDQGGLNVENAARAQEMPAPFLGCDDVLAPVEWFQKPK